MKTLEYDIPAAECADCEHAAEQNGYCSEHNKRFNHVSVKQIRWLAFWRLLVTLPVLVVLLWMVVLVFGVNR